VAIDDSILSLMTTNIDSTGNVAKKQLSCDLVLKAKRLLVTALQ